MVAGFTYQKQERRIQYVKIRRNLRTKAGKKNLGRKESQKSTY